MTVLYAGGHNELSRQHEALHSKRGDCDLSRFQTTVQKFVAVSTNCLPQRRRAILRQLVCCDNLG